MGYIVGKRSFFDVNSLGILTELDSVGEKDGCISDHAEVEVFYVFMQEVFLLEETNNFCQRLVIFNPNVASKAKCFQTYCELFASTVLHVNRLECLGSISHIISI